MTLLITGGGTGGHLAIAEALGEELGRRGIEVVYVGSVNGQDKQWFDKSNSPAGSHCIDLLDFEDSQATQPSSPPKSSKNSTSTTSRARIVDSSTKADSSENSPSLAEGVRGWVKSSDSPSPDCQNVARGARERVKPSNSVITSEQSECGTSLLATQVANECEARAGAVAKQNLSRIANDLQNTQLELQGDCHNLPLASLAMTEKERDCHADFQSARNNNSICRPWALAEVSIARKNNRDISGLSPQYDKDITYHAKQSDFLKKPHFDCFDKSLESSNDKAQFQKAFFSATYFLQTSGVVNKKGIAKILSLFYHLKSLKSIYHIFKKHDIKAVISVGGFSAAPASFGALLFNKPLFIHEQNAIKGKLNALLSPFAKRIFSSFSKNSVPYPTKSQARTNATVREEIKTIGFIGGSQGARTVNSLALSLAPTLINRGFNIIHQCGQNELESTKSSYKKLGLHCSQNEGFSPSYKNSIEVFGFSKDIIAKLAQVDICICRAGASSVWENAALGLPMIYIPYPYAAQNHQLHNAEFFTSRGLGHIVLESKKEKTKEQIEEMKAQILTHIDEYVKSPKKLESTSKSLIALASDDGAKIIIDEILAEISNK